jgi:metallo-beta-lactamase family protein
MKITLVDAAGGEVTGSCYIVQTKQARVLVDCGLFQGGKKSEALTVKMINAPRLPDSFNSVTACRRSCQKWAK